MSRRALGVVLAAVAAGLAVVATFLPYSWVGLDRDEDRVGFLTTGWGTRTEPERLAGIARETQFGVPVVIAAVVLLIGAALVFLPEHQRRAGRSTAIAGTGLLAGSVWTTFVVVAASLEPADQDVRTGLAHDYREGLWLLVAATALAVVATVLLHAAPPPPRPAGAIVHRVDDEADDDTDTPPFGLAVPVLPPDHPGGTDQGGRTG
ncbi:hypothetical protein [Saccharothrix obliqua]|uniref:hypothetical protein n=1 Tax=Saccharothrix obliqua TaxID=2861747 RepID=UPI001C6032BF|nr:hypothetical protein [Saccharothrix obliqua]MBW4721168.1 hypothetical protein [Saccharothrix obliqua]